MAERNHRVEHALAAFLDVLGHEFATAHAVFDDQPEAGANPFDVRIDDAPLFVHRLDDDLVNLGFIEILLAGEAMAFHDQALQAIRRRPALAGDAERHRFHPREHHFGDRFVDRRLALEEAIDVGR